LHKQNVDSAVLYENSHKTHFSFLDFD